MTAQLRTTDIVATHTTDELLQAVRGLVPMLRASAEGTEQLRQVPASHIEALVAAGVFRMTVPKSRGGLEAPVAMQNEVISEIARGCPSTGWVCALINSMNWMVALFPDQAQDEVYGTPDVRVTTVFTPTGKGKREADGVRVNGRWAWNTGAPNAHWAALATMVEEADGSVQPYYAMIPYSELSHVDDWFSSGLAGTGSRTTVATDVFVPEHRLLSAVGIGNGEFPGSTLAATNPYYSSPLVSVFIAGAGGALVGIAQGAMDVFMERLPGRGITYTDYTNQQIAPLTHHQVAEASLTLFSAKAHVLQASRLVDENLHRPMTLLERVEVKGHIGHAAKLARDAVATLFEASGASCIMQGVHIQRYNRDIQTLAIHAALLPTSSNETLGRVLVGLEPNTTLY